MEEKYKKDELENFKMYESKKVFAIRPYEPGKEDDLFIKFKEGETPNENGGLMKYFNTITLEWELQYIPDYRFQFEYQEVDSKGNQGKSDEDHGTSGGGG